MRTILCNGARLARRCRVVAAPLICLLILLPLTSQAYVLQGPHVLALMVSALAGVRDIKVTQKVTIEDNALADHPLVLDETLYYRFPDRFRSEARYESTHRIQVVAPEQCMTVLDDVRVDDHINRFDRYKDLLLYRDTALMHEMLLKYGIDVERTSLGRYNDHIVYVIGAQYPDDAVSQVWIDKERFLPLRWIDIAPGAPDDRVEFVYKDWRKLDGTWYPMHIETYHNQQRVRRIVTGIVDAHPIFEARLFDVAYMQTLYPRGETASPVEMPTSETDEVQRVIEDFQKKFEE
ncbi:MAG: hypothetical protein HKP58_01425 [Desulfatitalea sp.]|nr:hypothetical protein [Desulfatitalea sp.]NNJ99047.1 hypothetical protein [Desulfatitalea sp.]